MGESSDRELERLFDLDDAQGPARPIHATRSAAIIAAALHGAGFPPGGGSSGGGGAAGGAKSAVATKLALVASGAVLAIGATAWLLVRTPAPAAALPAPAPQPASVAVAAPGSAAASEPVSEPVSEDDVTLEPLDPPDSADAPVPPVAPARRTTRPRTHVRAEAPRTPAEATDLLARANAARLAHDWRAADALYRRVARGGGANGLAVQTAQVASAELHLEHLADPAGAARRFRAALAGGAGDVLAEDARWGLAESARAVGDAVAERRALDDFLAHHPASARAERARTRRAELGVAGADR